MVFYYFGLVCGGKFGYKLIVSFGYICFYVVCVGIVIVIVLLYVLVD